MSYSVKENQIVIKGLDGSRNSSYWGRVVMTNMVSGFVYKSVGTEFIYCECKKPGTPVLSYPYYAIKRSSTDEYFISTIVDPGRSCVRNISEEDEVVYRGSVKKLNDEANISKVLSFEAKFTDETATRGEYGESAVIIGDGIGLAYGDYTWSVTATNYANISTVSESVMFTICDDPVSADLISPESGLESSNRISLKINVDKINYGHPCDRNIEQDKTAIMYIEDAENGTIIAEKYVHDEQGLMKWDISQDLANPEFYQRTFKWYVNASNGETNISSEIRTFTLTQWTCEMIQCKNGECKTAEDGSAYCECEEGYSGERCENIDLAAQEFYVEITFEGAKATDINESELLESLSIMAQIEEDKIKIQTEIDDEGCITRVLVIVPDSAIAKVIADTVNELCT